MDNQNDPADMALLQNYIQSMFMNQSEKPRKSLSAEMKARRQKARKATKASRKKNRER